LNFYVSWISYKFFKEDITITKSFLILAVETKYKDLKKDSKEYEKYEAKARLNLINKIYQSHDNNLNEKYKVELNQRTIERVKNSFWWKLTQALRNLKENT